MLNTTNSTGLHAHWKEPSTLRVVRLIVFALIVLASMLGNSLVVKTVLALPKRRTPITYTLVFNLAIAELVNTMMLPFLISYDEMVSWMYGQFLCQLISPLQNVANSVITATVAAIAACRCCFLVFPRQAHRFQKHWYATVLVVVLWILSFALALPGFLFNRKVDSPFNKGTFWCITILPGDSHLSFPAAEFQAYIMVQITFNFVVNGTIMILSYGVVIYKLHNSEVYMNNNEPDIDENETTLDHMELPSKRSQLNLAERQPQEHNLHQQQELDQKQHGTAPTNKQEKEENTVQSMDNDLFRMFYAIVLIFILCYFPYQIVFIMEYFNVIDRKWEYLSVTRKYLLIWTSLPSALHPLCYGLMTKFYSRAFSKIILCK